jgi:proteic killer suppression protein
MTFADAITEKLANREVVKGIPADLAKHAAKRLDYLAAATRIEDLYVPPSNKFHALGGLKTKRYAIWVNRQWRISFVGRWVPPRQTM